MKEKERLNPCDDSQAGMWGHCALASQRPTESWWFQENSHHWSWAEDTTLASRNCRKQDILNSCLREVNYTFRKGLEPEEPGLQGVGFAIKHSLLESVEPRSNASGIPIQWPVYLCRTCENLQVLYPNLIFSIKVKRPVLWGALQRH